ncbi:calmodulin-like [Punica granatum]|uniref:Calmodulin-like n=1 Tax=Punica granatum TaxID=22663 RepID=A0A6P8BY34_PUNGR|nr:calmodulin-like [Punica granatum]
MEELRNAALANYQSLTEKQKGLAKEFFKSMDTDGDGSVSLVEFLEFLQEAGMYNGTDSADMFKMFDRDGNGTLDFNEVITLYYYLTLVPGVHNRSAARGIKEGKWNRAFKAMEAFAVGATVGQVIGGVAVAAACSIM